MAFDGAKTTIQEIVRTSAIAHEDPRLEPVLQARLKENWRIATMTAEQIEVARKHELYSAKLFLAQLDAAMGRG